MRPASRLAILLSLLALGGTAMFACSDDDGLSETMRGSLTVRVGDTIVVETGELAFSPLTDAQSEVKIFLLQNAAEEGDVTVTGVRLVTASPYITLSHGSDLPTCDEAGCAFEGFVLEPRNSRQFDVRYALPQNESSPQCGSGSDPEDCGYIEIASSDSKAPIVRLNLRVPSRGGNLQVCIVGGDCGSLQLDFNSAVPGDGPQTRSFTVENAGANVMQITEVTTNLTPANEFTLQTGPTPPFYLNTKEIVQYDLVFEPLVADAQRSGTIFIDSDAPLGGQATISVRVGNPNAAQIEVSPLTLAFPNVNQGQSQTKDVTITNLGGATAGPLTVGLAFDPSQTADYTVTNESDEPVAGPPCRVASPPASCTRQLIIPRSSSQIVHVTYAPTTADGTNATLRITSNDPDDADRILEVPLRGTSGIGVLTATPTSLTWLDVVPGAASTQSVVLKNEGSVAVVISGIAKRSFVPAAGADLFTLGVDPSTSPITLDAGQSQTVDLTFTRDAGDTLGQAYDGDLVFQHDGISGESIVTVSVRYN